MAFTYGVETLAKRASANKPIETEAYVELPLVS
nr:unnamed protein product [Callosobruchus chinensis]